MLGIPPKDVSIGFGRFTTLRTTEILFSTGSVDAEEFDPFSLFVLALSFIFQ